VENGAPEYPVKCHPAAESDPFPIEASTSEFLKGIAVLILKYNGSGPADLASFEETFQ
jgi:hypothetical protein